MMNEKEAMKVSDAKSERDWQGKLCRASWEASCLAPAASTNCEPGLESIGKAVVMNSMWVLGAKFVWFALSLGT